MRLRIVEVRATSKSRYTTAVWKEAIGAFVVATPVTTQVRANGNSSNAQSRPASPGPAQYPRYRSRRAIVLTAPAAKMKRDQANQPTSAARDIADAGACLKSVSVPVMSISATVAHLKRQQRSPHSRLSACRPVAI